MADYTYTPESNVAAEEAAKTSEFGQAFRQTRQQKLDIEKEKKIQDQNLGTLKELVKMAPMGKAAVGAGGSMSLDTESMAQQRMQNQQQRILGQEGTKLNKLGSDSSKKYEDAFHTFEEAHGHLDENSVYGDKAVAGSMGKMIEGQNRLFNSLLQQLGADKATLAGDINKKLNWFSGKAESGLTPEQRNAMRQFMFQAQQAKTQEFNDSLAQAKQMAPAVAPSLAQSGGIEQLIKPWGYATQQSIDRLEKRRQQYMQQGGQSPQAAQFQQPRSAMGNIADIILGKRGQSTQQAPQQAQDPEMQRYLELKQKYGK